MNTLTYYHRLALMAVIAILINLKPVRIYGQLTMDHQSRELTPPPTEAYNFIHYGQVGCSLYTGTVNLNIQATAICIIMVSPAPRQLCTFQ